MSKIVKTAEEWLDVKAYGTYEYKDGNTEVWSFNGDEYELNFLNLSLHERDELLYAKQVL